MKRRLRFKSGWIPVFALMLLATACKPNADKSQKAHFTVTITDTSKPYTIIKSGVFNTPVGASKAEPIGPGQSFEFDFTAPVGARLSLATMFAQSNDWFYSTGEDGMPLYKSDGSKITGDVTNQIMLYDAGTEADQEPGTGSNQAPRQPAPNTGPADPNPNVRLVSDSNIPAPNQIIKVTLMSDGTPYGFKVQIQNVSNSMTLKTSQGSVAVPLSPGVWLVHDPSQKDLLFKVGQPDYGKGLESLAEDGNPTTLGKYLATMTGITVPLSPGVFAVYPGTNPIFTEGQKAMSNGLESLAEDGNPAELSTYLTSDKKIDEQGLFDTPVGASSKGILTPGHSFTFSFDAKPGDKLTFATMYAQSNDWFYSPSNNGISLFTNGVPINGDITSQVYLWDAGTEANEEVGIGSNQAPRQPAPNTGPADPNPKVRMVGESMYPKVLKVTITPSMQ